KFLGPFGGEPPQIAVKGRGGTPPFPLWRAKRPKAKKGAPPRRHPHPPHKPAEPRRARKARARVRHRSIFERVPSAGRSVPGSRTLHGGDGRLQKRGEDASNRR